MRITRVRFPSPAQMKKRISKFHQISDEQLRSTAVTCRSMSELLQKLGVHRGGGTYSKVLKRILSLGIDVRNQGLRGISIKRRKYSTSDVLAGLHPSYATGHVKQRLLEEGVLKYECEMCKIDSWRGEKLSLELDHIDGNPHNHVLSNLRLLCPNCHSQTPTFRNRKRPHGGTVYMPALNSGAEKHAGSSPAEDTAQ